MKNLIYLTLLFSFYFNQKNIYKGIVTYKKEIISNVSDTEKGKDFFEKNPTLVNKMLKMEEESNKILEDLRFILFFNESESSFRVKEFLELENNRFYRYAVGPFGSGVYYNNKKENKKLLLLEAYGDKFLISTKMHEWQISNTQKKIGNYSCYKATTIKKVKGRNGLIEYPITAWFCPELSFSYQPLGYGGLPGLILELELNNEKYIVDKIEINPTRNVIVKKPNSGIKVTKEEFEEIGLKTMSNYKKSIKK